MAAILQRVVSDQFKIYGLKSDATIWVTNAIEPLVWTQMPAFSGTGKLANIALARTTPDDGTLSLYGISSDGTFWRLRADGIWYAENTP